MMRNKSTSSMQKTYDECYLMCSTAVFFEGQNNEAEALRSWRTALDQIYYHNAYRVPAGYTPKTETDRALFDSLKQLENQCKERVELLEALKQSRKDAYKAEKKGSLRRRLEKGRSVDSLPTRSTTGWLGDDTIPPVSFSDLPSVTPTYSPRPSLPPSRASEVGSKSQPVSINEMNLAPLTLPPTLPVASKQISRSPSPGADGSRKPMRTTLRAVEKKGFRSARSSEHRRPAPVKAAGLAWDAQPVKFPVPRPDSDPTIEARLISAAARRSIDTGSTNSRTDDSKREDVIKMPDPADFIPHSHWRDVSGSHDSQAQSKKPTDKLTLDTTTPTSSTSHNLANGDIPPIPPPHRNPVRSASNKSITPKSPTKLPKSPELSYRREFPSPTSTVPPALAKTMLDRAYQKPSHNARPATTITRKPVPSASADPPKVRKKSPRRRAATSTSESENETQKRTPERSRRPRTEKRDASKAITPPSTDPESPEEDTPQTIWDKKAAAVLKNLPKGIDENVARSILNEIVVKGDEVHWDDVAGLDAAKKALKEAVVYPFLRPDLFMGLREPARGMLLFGPPGTGKTMLARAVATESKSTFFAISASSLTSKWHGESEKLVRALFALAKVLAPSIIFVDEIDSLLSARSGSTEHEASRRSKTEFLIQWSDLQRAAAGKDTSPGDATRVLVLAATNCPWDVDDAARRRFVRRQYIPLPEGETREKQLRNLLGHQKHGLSAEDIANLIELTDGYSGSDITALAKDAAMGPLRNLGEALLFTPMDQIRPIQFDDFKASLESIRPSVSKKGLEEFEKWAKEFGERGG